MMGKVMVEELLKDQKFTQIRALDLNKPTFTDPKVENLVGNIMNKEQLEKAFEGAEAVFHIASVVNLSLEPHLVSFLRKVNVVGTQNVINACVKKRVSRLIYTCSGTAAFSGKFTVMTEETSKKDYSVTPYARSKL